MDDNIIAKKIVDMIPDSFNGSLLDVPVGTAVFTIEKYKKLKFASITCLDYSVDMLKQAKQRFEKNKLTNITCVQGDVGKLQFKDESFDFVLSMNGFHVFPDKDKAFYETARVLKKGGTFCGSFYIKGECKRSDFVANMVLSKKGWFTPPFQTKEELIRILNHYYSKVELYSEKALVLFRCEK
ncbi:class I SAM-dependent methyltransferase [Oscillospiraceae bacterium PP1C4]